MATKTIQVKLPGRTGETDLRVILSLGSTVVNPSGAVLTEVVNSRGFFEGDVVDTFSTGSYGVEIINTLGTLLSGGYVFSAGDIDEDLLVDDPSLTAATLADIGTNAATAATEIGKVHRSATAVAAGVAMRRNAVAVTATTLDETLAPTP